jgi:preprotein translocase subunit SecE
VADEKDTETPDQGAAESDDAALNQRSVDEGDSADDADPGQVAGAEDLADEDVSDEDVSDEDADDDAAATRLSDADELDARFAEQVSAARSDDDADDTDDDDNDDDDNDDGDELVAVGAAGGRSAGRSGGSSAVAAKQTPRLKKDRPTRRQGAAQDEPKRTGPVEFVKGSVSELKKVVYPTGPQLANLFVVVLIFVLMVIAIVTALDAGFGWVMLRIFA